MAQNVGARSTSPTGAVTTAGATPADGAGRQIERQPHQPVDVVRALEQQAEVALQLAVVGGEDDVDVVAPAAALRWRASTRPSASSISSHSTALRALTSRTWSAVSVAGTHVARRLVVRDERAVVPAPPVARLGVEDRARARPPTRGSRPAAARRASRRGRARTAGGSHGWCGSGKLIQQNQSSSASSESSQAIVRSATQSVWYHSRGIGLSCTCGAPVSPPPAALTSQVAVEHRVEHRRPPRGARRPASGRSAAARRRRGSPNSRCSKPRCGAGGIGRRGRSGSRRTGRTGRGTARSAALPTARCGSRRRAAPRRPTARRPAAARRSSTRRGCSGAGR